jgi:tRNA 2-selenouridine synthase
MAETRNIDDFLNELSSTGNLLLDVRSESEFRQGHIPGAVNFPLLNDEHRVIVGTTYKQKGREAAVLKGFELVGNKFGDFAKSALELSGNKKAMVYCWRGGMRSNIMAWVISMAGMEVTLLKGGYKAFRRWSLEQFTKPKKIVVMGGRTGTGKTEVLKLLKKRGEQVIDLEGLAHHKGSAFGALGEKPQPRTEYFENQIAMQWRNVDENKILWMENESILIGSVKIPDAIFEMMRKAPVIELDSDIETRMKRILRDYGKFPVDILAESTMKLTKRLGDLRARKAVEALVNGDKKTWMEETLSYYDKSYDFGRAQRSPERIFTVKQEENESMESVADRVISVSKQLEKYFE